GGRGGGGRGGGGGVRGLGAAGGAWRASSTRALVSFIAASVAAPTLISATPPEILARRSWNFSLSYSLSVSSIWRRSWSIRFWMSAFLPAPWIRVVLSLLTLTCLALPSWPSWRFSSFSPRSSLITVPPVRTARSPSI